MNNGKKTINAPLELASHVVKIKTPWHKENTNVKIYLEIQSSKTTLASKYEVNRLNIPKSKQYNKIEYSILKRVNCEIEDKRKGSPLLTEG